MTYYILVNKFNELPEEVDAVEPPTYKIILTIILFLYLTAVGRHLIWVFFCI